MQPWGPNMLNPACHSTLETSSAHPSTPSCCLPVLLVVTGNGVSKVPLYCNEGYVGASHVVGVEWYDGILGFSEPNCPVLAICLDNGRMQLMRYESDDNAICIDTGIKPCKCKWNCNGR